MTGLLPATERVLLYRLARAQADCRVPSLVAGLVRDGELVWSAGRGRVGGREPDADTQYRIGSITKTFVGALMLLLRDRGELRLEDTLASYVPGTPVGDRTLAQLLSHGSGLQSEVPGEWWERSAGRDWPTLAGQLGADSVLGPAGRRFHYSNPGIALLGQVVEHVRGHAWFDVLRDEVLSPLGLSRTTYGPEPVHAQGYAVHPYADVLLAEPHTDTLAMAPAGQLWSTVADLTRWCTFLAGDTAAVLDPATVEEMRRPILVEDAEPWTRAYGLGVQVFRLRGRRLFGHGGSMPGFLASMLVDGDEHVAVVTMANTTSGLSGELDLDLVELLAEHEPAIPREWRPARVPAEDLDLVGTWYWGPRPHTLRAAADGELELRAVGQGRGARFRPGGDGTWTGLDGYHAGETLRAVRRPDGTVRHLDIGTFCFTRLPYDPDAPVPGGLPEEGWTAD